MAQFNQVDHRYEMSALMAAYPLRRWDQVARLMPSRFMEGARGKSAIFGIRSTPTVSTTALPLNAAATTSQVPVVSQVEIEMYEYGEDPLSVNMAWQAAYSYNDELGQNVNAAAEQAMHIRNKLIVKGTLDAYTGNTSYTHGTGTYTPTTDNLVYLGTDTTTETARSAIATGDTFTSDAWVHKAREILAGRGVKPFMFSDGFEGYVAMCPPQLVGDIMRVSSGEWRAFVYTSETRLARGIIGDWQGFRWIEDPLSFYPSAGSGSVHVAAITFMGQDYIGVPSLPVAQLPPLTGSGAIVNVDEFTQVRVTPQNDPHGRLSWVSPYMIMGSGILDPRNAFRLECYSTNQAYSAAQIALRS